MAERLRDSMVSISTSAMGESRNAWAMNREIEEYLAQDRNEGRIFMNNLRRWLDFRQKSNGGFLKTMFFPERTTRPRQWPVHFSEPTTTYRFFANIPLVGTPDTSRAYDYFVWHFGAQAPMCPLFRSNGSREDKYDSAMSRNVYLDLYHKENQYYFGDCKFLSESIIIVPVDSFEGKQVHVEIFRDDGMIKGFPLKTYDPSQNFPKSNDYIARYGKAPPILYDQHTTSLQFYDPALVPTGVGDEEVDDSFMGTAIGIATFLSGWLAESFMSYGAFALFSALSSWTAQTQLFQSFLQKLGAFKNGRLGNAASFVKNVGKFAFNKAKSAVSSGAGAVSDAFAGAAAAGAAMAGGRRLTAADTEEMKEDLGDLLLTNEAFAEFCNENEINIEKLVTAMADRVEQLQSIGGTGLLGDSTALGSASMKRSKMMRTDYVATFQFVPSLYQKVWEADRPLTDYIRVLCPPPMNGDAPDFVNTTCSYAANFFAFIKLPVANFEIRVNSCYETKVFPPLDEVFDVSTPFVNTEDLQYLPSIAQAFPHIFIATREEIDSVYQSFRTMFMAPADLFEETVNEIGTGVVRRVRS